MIGYRSAHLEPGQWQLGFRQPRERPIRTDCVWSKAVSIQRTDTRETDSCDVFP